MKDGRHVDFQKAKYQNEKNVGHTVEGRYKLELNADPDRKAKIINGEIVRAKENGIENLVDMTDPSQPGKTFIAPDWGENRIRMIPVNVKQPNSTATKEDDRDLNSFYFHDSEKGYSHGCYEIQKQFFVDLKKYQELGN
jgi:hypothetical protein